MFILSVSKLYIWENREIFVGTLEASHIILF